MLSEDGFPEQRPVSQLR